MDIMTTPTRHHHVQFIPTQRNWDVMVVNGCPSWQTTGSASCIVAKRGFTMHQSCFVLTQQEHATIECHRKSPAIERTYRRNETEKCNEITCEVGVDRWRFNIDNRKQCRRKEREGTASQHRSPIRSSCTSGEQHTESVRWYRLRLWELSIVLHRTHNNVVINLGTSLRR